MPAALGWHPWFRRRSAEARLRVDADEVLVTRELIPTGERTQVRGMTDLRRGPAIAGRRLDHAYVDARSPAVVAWPDLELTIEFGPPASIVVVHTPPRGLCVEPQTAWPDASSSELRRVPGHGSDDARARRDASGRRCACAGAPWLAAGRAARGRTLERRALKRRALGAELWARGVRSAADPDDPASSGAPGQDAVERRLEAVEIDLGDRLAEATRSEILGDPVPRAGVARRSAAGRSRSRSAPRRAG